MPVAETTNTFLVEEVKKKLKSYKSCQNTKVYKCPLQNSYWKMAQWVRLSTVCNFHSPNVVSGRV